MVGEGRRGLANGDEVVALGDRILQLREHLRRRGTLLREVRLGGRNKMAEGGCQRCDLNANASEGKGNEDLIWTVKILS